MTDLPKPSSEDLTNDQKNEYDDEFVIESNANECQQPPLDTENECENWRGMAQPKPGRKRRSTYLDPQSEWCTINLSNDRKVSKLGLLKMVIGLN